MKKVILFLLVVCSMSAKAQTLKELLYSGKLKKDSSAVIRKTDDLQSRIDTSTKKAEPEPEKPVTPATAAVEKSNVAVDSSVSAVNTASNPTENATAAAPAKNNNKLWKEYSDSLVAALKTEVLNSKKVKKETYYIMVDYELDVDGQVGITNVSVSPDNSFLSDQVKERLLTSPPRLSPAIDSSNKARKVKRRYSFTVTKE